MHVLQKEKGKEKEKEQPDDAFASLQAFVPDVVIVSARFGLLRPPPHNGEGEVLNRSRFREPIGAGDAAGLAAQCERGSPFLDSAQLV